MTEWEQFRALDLDLLRQVMAAPVVVDLRKIYRAEDMARHGFVYLSIGTAIENPEKSRHQIPRWHGRHQNAGLPRRLIGPVTQSGPLYQAYRSDRSLVASHRAQRHGLAIVISAAAISSAAEATLSCGANREF